MAAIKHHFRQSLLALILTAFGSPTFALDSRIEVRNWLPNLEDQEEQISKLGFALYERIEIIHIDQAQEPLYRFAICEYDQDPDTGEARLFQGENISRIFRYKDVPALKKANCDEDTLCNKNLDFISYLENERILSKWLHDGSVIAKDSQHRMCLYYLNSANNHFQDHFFQPHKSIDDLMASVDIDAYFKFGTSAAALVLVLSRFPALAKYLARGLPNISFRTVIGSSQLAKRLAAFSPYLNPLERWAGRGLLKTKYAQTLTKILVSVVGAAATGTAWSQLDEFVRSEVSDYDSVRESMAVVTQEKSEEFFKFYFDWAQSPVRHIGNKDVKAAIQAEEAAGYSRLMEYSRMPDEVNLLDYLQFKKDLYHLPPFVDMAIGGMSPRQVFKIKRSWPNALKNPYPKVYELNQAGNAVIWPQQYLELYFGVAQDAYEYAGYEDGGILDDASYIIKSIKDGKDFTLITPKK